MKLIRNTLYVVALASLFAQASPQVYAQNSGGIGAAGMIPAGPVDRVVVGRTLGESASPAGMGTLSSPRLAEGRSVASGKRHCRVNTYGDRQCEYR